MADPRILRVIAAAGCVAGLVAVAQGQDSIGLTTGSNGLPGDAPSAFQAGSGAPPNDTRQVLRYVVDLSAKTTSWGNLYALGPAVKSSKSNSSGFFSQLIGAQAASNRFAYGPVFAASNYAVWTNAPGTGVNPPQNTAATSSVSGAGAYGYGFGLGFMEFGAGIDGALGTADDEQGIIGSIVNFQNRVPNRLLITRVVAAGNKTTTTASGTASLGLGSIDEAGNLHAYADGFGLVSSLRLTQRNLLRFKVGARNPAVLNNVFQNVSVPSSGDPGALDVVRTSTTPMTVPGMISSKVPGGLNRPVMLSSDLASNYIAETATFDPLTTATPPAAYLPATSGPRGGVAFVPQTFAPVNTAGTDIGTCATLARTDANTKTRGIQVFGVSPAGAVDGLMSILLPSVSGQIVDPTDSFAPGTAFSPLSAHEFTNYQSQASFRGGSSQVAMTVLPGGDLLVAGLVAATGGGSAVPQGQDNYLAVARVPAAGGTPSWTVAAHTGNASGFAGGQSKAILGRTNPNDPLTPIGRLARYTEVFGTATTGPSISSAAMDRAGNLYFMATMGLTGTSGTTFTTGLVRANRDSTTGAYQLELIAQLGDVIAGANSGKNYQVQFLGVADADSVDSGTIFSSSIVQDGVAGADAANASYGSPFSLGALAFKAKIVYDVDGDGLYADPSGAVSVSTSVDQAYDVVMVLMPRSPRADFNRSGGVTIDDLFLYFNAYFQGQSAADWNGDGTVSIDDLFLYINDWFLG